MPEGKLLDLTSDDDFQVEIMAELGTKDRYKLYVHHKGRTIVRICKLKAEQILVEGFRVDTMSAPQPDPDEPEEPSLNG